MTLRKRLIGAASALVLSSAGLLLGPAAPAWAYPTVTICNHYLSVDYIQAYNNSTRREAILGPGECSDFDNTGGNARVDVDLPGGKDVDSWKKYSYFSGKWGPCYANEDESSNPYDTGARYRTYVNDFCAE